MGFSSRSCLLLVSLFTCLPLTQDRYEPIRARIRAGETTTAEDELQRILKATPNDALAHFYLGTIHAMRRDHVSAIVEYREAIRFVHAHLGLASVYGMNPDTYTWAAEHSPGSSGVGAEKL